jgi:trehalose-phosphatase
VKFFVEQVMEVRPNIEWNKGHDLGYLLKSFAFDTQNDHVLPLYIGDDASDEDAFKVILVFTDDMKLLLMLVVITLLKKVISDDRH